MNEESLWTCFNDLAQELILCSFSLREEERKEKLLALHITGAKLEQLLLNRHDEYQAVCRMEGLIYRASSAVSAAEQCENIREKSTRQYSYIQH